MSRSRELICELVKESYLQVQNDKQIKIRIAFGFDESHRNHDRQGEVVQREQYR